MAAMKYDKYITTECVKEITKRPGAFITSTRHIDDFGGGELSVDAIYINRPHLMLTQSHQHEFAQYLSFFSSNPDDPKDFDAEIELSLGEEQEKHVNRVLKSVLDPLDWESKVALMEALLKRLEPHLPPEIISQPRERFAVHYEIIVRAYVQSQVFVV